METVNLTCNVRFQNMEPFQGFIRAILGVPISETNNPEDEFLVAQLKPQEQKFDTNSSSVTLSLIPNELLKGDTFYKIEIWRSVQKNGSSTINTLLFEYPVFIPNNDCNLENLTILEPIVAEGTNIVDICKMYASQVKNDAVISENLVKQATEMVEETNSLLDSWNTNVSNYVNLYEGELNG